MKRASRNPKRPSSGARRPPTDANASAPWETRLCELELRLTQLESENRQLRDACRHFETASANYANLYHLIPIGLVTLGLRGTILRINRTGAALLGRDAARLLQRRFDFLVAPEDLRKFSAQLRECRLARKMVLRELSLRGAAGERVLVQLAIAPVLDEKSRVSQVEITLVNLTDRARADAALRATERYLHTFIQSSPHPIQLLDQNAYWLLANRAALELFELTGVDYHHHHSLELAARSPFYRAVLAAREQRDRAVMKTGRLSRGDERVPKPDGSERTFDVIRVPLLQPGGQPMGVAVLSYDVTERKQSEASMELVSRLPQENPSPVMRLHQGRFVSYINPAAQPMLTDWGVPLGGEAPGAIAQTALASMAEGRQRNIEWSFHDRAYVVTFVPIVAAGYVNLYFSDMTERKQAEVALRESEDRFRILAAHAPVGIFRSDSQGNVVYVNESWCKIAGLQPEQALGKGWLKAIHAEDRKRIISGWQEALARGKSYTTEFRFWRPGRKVTWVQGNVVKLPGTSGASLGYAGTVADITARKEAEQSLRQAGVELEARVRRRTLQLTDTNRALHTSEAKLQAIMDNSPSMIFLKDTRGRYLHFNLQFAREFKLSPKEAFGKTDAELFPPRQAAMFRRNDLKVLKSGQPVISDETAMHQNGPHSSIVTKYPLRNVQGKIYAIGGIVTDITARRRAEEALQESEKNLAEFFEQAPLGLMWVSPGGTIKRINQAQLNLLGCTRDQCLGRKLARFFTDPELAVEGLNQLAQHGTLQNYRARLHQRNGNIRHVLLDANGLWRNDQFLYSRWFVRDITHRVELEQEILAISERERQRLGQDLHDDLCQQLSGVEFLSHSLAGRLEAGPRGEGARAREIAGMIRTAIERTRELARGLSPMGLVEDGLMLALRGLADHTQKFFHITCRFRCDAPVLINDAVAGIHLYRIAQEAINNSVKHGKSRRIDIGLTQTSITTTLVVRDDGVGFPVKLRKRQGMGLRIMQYRAGVLGGSVIVQRQVNGGTTVVCNVKIPGEPQASVEGKSK